MDKIKLSADVDGYHIEVSAEHSSAAEFELWASKVQDGVPTYERRSGNRYEATTT